MSLWCPVAAGVKPDQPGRPELQFLQQGERQLRLVPIPWLGPYEEQERPPTGGSVPGPGGCLRLLRQDLTTHAQTLWGEARGEV